MMNTQFNHYRSANDDVESSVSTRRNFLRFLPAAGAGIFGIGAFLQTCAEEKVFYSAELAKHYLESILGIIVEVKERELPKIQQAASLAVQTRLHGNDLYASLDGGMLPSEFDSRRPGIPRVFKSGDVQDARRGDLVITGEPDRVRGFSERMIKVVGITKPSVLNNSTPPYALENMGTFRIEDFSVIVINCHVPYTDGILPVEGIDDPICPASGVVRSVIVHSLAAEIVEGLAKNGIYPEIG